MMPDDIEVSTDDKQPETPVSFVEDSDHTLVTVGGEEKASGGARDNEERWRAAEASQNRLAGAFDELRSRLTGGPGPSQAPSSAPDPYQHQLDAITEQERALGIQWEAHKAAGRLTPSLLTEFDQKSRNLQQQRSDVSAQRAIQGALPTFIQAAQRQQYAQQYGDVQGNPHANRWARGRYDQLLAEGLPDSPQTVERAMNEARRQFGMRTSGGYQPSQQDRQQLTGFSGSNRRSVEPKDNVVKMGKSEKIMAMAMYGDAFNGDEKKAYAQWAKGPGIRAQKAMQRGRQQQR